MLLNIFTLNVLWPCWILCPRSINAIYSFPLSFLSLLFVLALTSLISAQESFLFLQFHRIYINVPLVSRDCIILPPVHIKLEFMKQYVKARNQDGEYCKHITKMFPKIVLKRQKLILLRFLRSENYEMILISSKTWQLWENPRGLSSFE